MNKRWLLALVAALVIYLGLGLVFGLRDLGSTLQKLPGRRTDPPVSEPRAKGT